MLTSNSPRYLHFLQNATLILISLLFLPISNFILCLSYATLPFLSREDAARRRIRRSPNFHPRTILVTGVGMTKGLMLARTFYIAGHNVVGADFESYGIPVCGRFSRALSKFHALSKPNETDGSTHYIRDLLRIVRHERVDIWVSCSGVASAVEDGQAKEVLERQSDCRCIQFDVSTIQTLHEKDTFIEQTARLGLPTPETYNVTSRAAVHKVLHDSPRTKKKYIMKTLGMNDAARGNMTILPRRTLSETYNHLSNIPISNSKPWVLQQFISGREYCTHALVINSQVKAFVSCPSSELLMYYEALPPESALNAAMLRFTQEFASRYPSNMTGHLSFDFLVEERVSEKGAEMALVPIECNPRAHTAVALFQGREIEMANAYLSILAPQMNGHTSPESSAPLPQPLIPLNPPRYYWLGHDIIALLLYPILSLFLRRISFRAYMYNCSIFLPHLLIWKDGTYERWDPLPFWWLYHIYFPGQFLVAILGGKWWSRVNVSTVKMFGC